MTAPKHSIGLRKVVNVLLGWLLIQHTELYAELVSSGGPSTEPDLDSTIQLIAADLGLVLDKRVAKGLIEAAQEFEEWTSGAPAHVLVLGPTTARSALYHRVPGCTWPRCILPLGHELPHHQAAGR